jgi:hypothetical protein
MNQAPAQPASGGTGLFGQPAQQSTGQLNYVPVCFCSPCSLKVRRLQWALRTSLVNRPQILLQQVLVPTYSVSHPLELGWVFSVLPNHKLNKDKPNLNPLYSPQLHAHHSPLHNSTLVSDLRWAEALWEEIQWEQAS